MSPALQTVEGLNASFQYGLEFGTQILEGIHTDSNTEHKMCGIRRFTRPKSRLTLVKYKNRKYRFT